MEMAKHYTDELTAWVEKRSDLGRDRNLVTFHGVRQDVAMALEAGFSAKTVWANMHESGRVGFGYETFLSYVNRFIKKSPASKPGVLTGNSIVATDGATSTDRVRVATALPAPQSPSSTAADSASSTRAIPLKAPPAPITPTKRTGMPTFKFNPVPTNRENSN